VTATATTHVTATAATHVAATSAAALRQRRPSAHSHRASEDERFDE